MSRRARSPLPAARRRAALAALALLALVGVELLCRAGEDPLADDFPPAFALLDQRVARRGLAGIWGAPGLGPEDGFAGPTDFEAPLPAGARRVVVTGTGHSKGENLPAHLRWAHRLEGALVEDRLQVVNLSMQGATALLLERGLLPRVLAAEPAVVIFGYSGFNEALRADLPDRWSLRPASGLTNLGLSSAAARRLLPLALSLPRRARGEPDPPPRVSVAEFRRSMGASLDALRDGGAAVVVLLDHVVSPDIPGAFYRADVAAYRSAARAEAESRGLAVLDPAALLPPPDDRWFEGRLLYNADAHARIAEALAPLVREALGP